MMGHTDKEFDQELATLADRLVKMGARASEQIALAMRALTERHDDLARQVVTGDTIIDRDEVEIDALAMQILAQRQPVATDLRFITMALKFVVDVERIGDLACGIAKRALEVNRLPVLDSRIDLNKMASLVQKNLHLALDSFARRDADQAAEVIKCDLEIDRVNANLFAELLAHLATDPSTVTRVLPLTSVCRYLERIGDHVKNIAEDVIFLARGVNVRHRGAVPQG